MSSNLAALVGSRICHDLISPIGAIGNGVELLSLTDGDTSAEMQLISESVENANARIRFFRIAFGSASADQSVRHSEIISILKANARAGRFSYLWNVENETGRQDVRVAFLVMQCLETSMPLGGEISVSAEAGVWRLTASGKRIDADPELWGALSRGAPPLAATPSQVQFALLPDALQEAGRNLSYYIGDGRISVRF